MITKNHSDTYAKMLLQKISLLKLSELKRQRCPDTPSYASREMKYNVPFFIYALNGAKPPKKLPTQGNYMSHYEISKILAHYLGYNTNNMCKSENGFFICGQDIRGLSGILKIKFDENSTMKKKRVR